MSVLAATAWVAVAAGCADGRAVSGRSAVATILDRLARERPRPVEGRLSAGRGYAPYGGGATPADAPLPPDLLPGRPARVLRGAPAIVSAVEPPDLHAAGLVSLYRGHPAAAVDALERAAGHEPSADRLSDLAAAYLALAKRDRPWLLLDAIEAADRAVELDPASARAAFNLALALERLFLVHQAEQAWERYLAIEREAAWRADAEGHLEVIRAPTVAERWQTVRPRVLADAAAGDREAVARWAKTFPLRVKELIEDGFASWAVAADDEHRASKVIATLQVLADAVALTASEDLYVDAVAAIARVQDAQGSTQGDLADAHTLFDDGRKQRHSCLIAEERFGEAERLFEASASPMRLAAAYQRLVCVYQRDRALARSGFEALRASTASRPTLDGMVLTMLALCTGASGSTDRSIELLEGAYLAFSRVGDPRSSAAAGQLADELIARGRKAEAWRYRQHALSQAARSGDRRARHNELFMIGRELEGFERARSAHQVAAEMVENARAWGSAAAVVETNVLLARAARDGGDHPSAATALRAATEALAGVTDPAIRRRLAIGIDLTAGIAKRVIDPAVSLEAIDSALATMEATGHGEHRVEALIALGKGLDAMDRDDEALAAYDRAIRETETYRATTSSELDRMILAGRAQQAYDAAIDLSARNGQAREALDWLRRAQARELRARQSPRVAEASDPAFSDLVVDRIHDSLVVAYAMLDDSLLIWVLGPHIEILRLPTPRIEIERAAEELLRAVDGQTGSASIDHSLSRLYALVVAPIESKLIGDTPTIFVPDRALQHVPFTALLDPASGRYLIEDRAVAVAASVDLALGAGGGTVPTDDGAVLIVGDPAFDPAIVDLPRLQGAAREARAVAAMYPAAESLLEEDATASRIRALIAGRTILHFAAHVVIDPERPLRSFLAAAPDPSQRSDGRLFTDELDRLELDRAELVFLSGCETAPRLGLGSREGAVGLIRPFLAAGVPSVVATLWATEDSASASFATSFHQAVRAGLPAAGALRAAARALIRTDHASPLDWAPFQLFVSNVPRRTQHVL